jgi:beta-galactosidase
MNHARLVLPAFLALLTGPAFAQPILMDRLLFGVAYYDEYMPYERLDEDVRMMKEAGINVVRIAESTWSTLEPRDGVFDFRHVDRVLDAMRRASIRVIPSTTRRRAPRCRRCSSST